jgi:hypothetical protein
VRNCKSAWMKRSISWTSKIASTTNWRRFPAG